jgi:hypothetical protein
MGATKKVHILFAKIFNKSVIKLKQAWQWHIK